MFFWGLRAAKAGRDVQRIGGGACVYGGWLRAMVPNFALAKLVLSVIRLWPVLSLVSVTTLSTFVWLAAVLWPARPVSLPLLLMRPAARSGPTPSLANRDSSLHCLRAWMSDADTLQSAIDAGKASNPLEPKLDVRARLGVLRRLLTGGLNTRDRDSRQCKQGSSQCSCALDVESVLHISWDCPRLSSAR